MTGARTDAGRETARDTRRTDTREQIRSVALELFAERGYDATSLREIAERLGVTKAAVYYHFRTKEEILASLFEQRIAEIDEIIAWAGEQEPGPARSRGIIERYSATLSDRGAPQFGRMIQGQQSLKDFGPGAEMGDRFRRLGELLQSPGTSLEERLRARLALAAVHMGTFAVDMHHGDPEEVRAAALRVALDLAGPGRH